MKRLEAVEKQINSEEFKYTTGKGCLTLEQRRFYEENGYIVIKNFLSDSDIKSWTDRFIEYCDRKVTP